VSLGISSVWSGSTLVAIQFINLASHGSQAVLGSLWFWKWAQVIGFHNIFFKPVTVLDITVAKLQHTSNVLYLQWYNNWLNNSMSLFHDIFHPVINVSWYQFLHYIDVTLRAHLSLFRSLNINLIVLKRTWKPLRFFFKQKNKSKSISSIKAVKCLTVYSTDMDYIT
jgi:hypothetical protein